MSRVTKLLIPLSYINESCAVSTNIDEKKIKPSVFEAQMDLRGLLGAEFYTEIENQYLASGGSFSPDNETLYEDYIKDFLAWTAYFYSLGFSQTESTATGERTFKDDNSELASDIQIFSKEKNVKRIAYKFKSAMLDFLELSQHNDATKYPKWSKPCRDQFQFGISAVGRDKDEIVAVFKAVTNNE